MGYASVQITVVPTPNRGGADPTPTPNSGFADPTPAPFSIFSTRGGN